MDREVSDLPGEYDVTVTITAYEPDREIARNAGRLRPQIGHVYGYRLEAVADGTQVTSYCDWSGMDPVGGARSGLPDRACLGVEGDVGDPGADGSSRRAADCSRRWPAPAGHPFGFCSASGSPNGTSGIRRPESPLRSRSSASSGETATARAGPGHPAAHVRRAGVAGRARGSRAVAAGPVTCDRLRGLRYRRLPPDVYARSGDPSDLACGHWRPTGW
jgi:hypothetical protein